LLPAFGSEYALRPEWNWAQRLYVAAFGVVDLPMRIRANEVMRELRKWPCTRVLDLGTGTGAFAFYLTRDPRCEVVATDVDANRIDTVKSIASRLHRTGLSALRGGDDVLRVLPANAFSTVLAIEVLQYFPDPERTLHELCGRLRPGGVLIAHVPLRKALWKYEHTLFTDDLLRTLCRKAGFEEPEIRPTVGRKSLFLSRAFARCAKVFPLLAVAYPLLLLLATVTPLTAPTGQSRLVIARKPGSRSAEE
jgi:SAM-dependent methyltransferase